MSQEEKTTERIFRGALGSLMDATGMTQVELAKVTGVSQGAVSRWLNGSIPSGDVLFKIAQCFSVPMENLVGPPAPLHKNPPLPQRFILSDLASFEERAAEIMQSLSELIEDIGDLKKMIASGTKQSQDQSQSP